MSGINILVEYNAFQSPLWPTVLAAIYFSLIPVSVFIECFDEIFNFIIIITFIFIALSFANILNSKTVHQKATIDKNVSFVEFDANYTLVGKEGDLYIVIPKTSSD